MNYAQIIVIAIAVATVSQLLSHEKALKKLENRCKNLEDSLRSLRTAAPVEPTITATITPPPVYAAVRDYTPRPSLPEDEVQTPTTSGRYTLD